MDTGQDLVNKLEQDIKKMEKRIEYIKLYSIKNKIVRVLLKTGIELYYALPIIFAIIVAANSIPWIENALIHMKVPESTFFYFNFVSLLCIESVSILTIKKLGKVLDIKNKLHEYESLFCPMTKEELETMKKILEIRKQNIAMLTENNTEENRKKSYRLRKDIGI